jgi:hypothetical protein
MGQLTRHEGGCHCGAVRYEVELPASFEVERCNCSICSMSGNLSIIVPARRFRLLQGEERLRRYTFNTEVAQHLFCGRCGVKSYYIPRSNPDGVAVTWRCIDDWRSLDATICDFDGVNWEENAAKVRHKSRE